MNSKRLASGSRAVILAFSLIVLIVSLFAFVAPVCSQGPDFSISVSHSSGSVNAGGSITENVSLTPISGFSSTVSLTASGLLAGATASFSPSSGVPSFTSALTISTDSTTPAGTYSVTITGTGGEITHTCVYELIVTLPPTPSVPVPTAEVNPLYGTTPEKPLLQTTTSVTISGTGMTTQVGRTINVYIINAGTVVTAKTETTIVESDGSWSKTITLPAAGTEYKIDVTCTGVAGNEGAHVLYGYVLVDLNAPTVAISKVEVAGVTLTSPYSTDQATVVISGTISKDTWETYNSGAVKVTATVQVGSASAGTVTIDPNGTFSISAALSEGNNTITVTATDSAVNMGSASITVTRAVTQWATYAIVLVIIGLILAAIVIFRKR